MRWLSSDLEAPGAFARALGARSAGHEIILMLSDADNVHWAHNQVLNLEELGLRHHLLIGSDAATCASFLRRLPDSGCGSSSYLRRGHNASVDAALDRWGIVDWHPFHLWWQRWHYLALAVSLNYNALSIDTDLSFRYDPYPLLRGAFDHRQMLVGVESLSPGRKNRYIFPAINAGFVYCQGAPDGMSHWVLAEVDARLEAALLGAVVRMNASSEASTVVERFLWDQDHFKDVVESAAFGVWPPSYRHVLYYANRSPEWLQPLARRRLLPLRPQPRLLLP